MARRKSKEKKKKDPIFSFKTRSGIKVDQHPQETKLKFRKTTTQDYKRFFQERQRRKGLREIEQMKAEDGWWQFVYGDVMG